MNRTHSTEGLGPFLQPMAHVRSAVIDTPILIERGEGVHVIDTQGRRLVDGLGGLWNVNLGHSCEPVKEAIRRQLDALPYYNSFKGCSHPGVIALSQQLISLLEPEGMARVFFNSGGSDAVETALKLARQSWKLAGEAGRTKFIALRQGYHGVHFGGASLTGINVFRLGFEPMLAGCFHIDSPWLYRNAYTDDPIELGRIVAGQLEREILAQGAGSVAAFIAEPVQGAGGVIVPPDNFWPLAREVCDRHGVLFIADEVVTGFGRTGALTGSRGWGVKPDIMCFAKGITSGYVPFGATAVNQRIASVFEQAPPDVGYLMHGYTYSGHPLGVAAAGAALEQVIARDIPAKAAARGRYFLERLKPFEQRFQSVGEVRGKGLMLCLDLVSDKRTRQPAPPESRFTESIARETARRGALVRAVGNNIILSPPLIIEEPEIDVIVEALAGALTSVTLT
jgi:putrescine---pyruvate transaminase